MDCVPGMTSSTPCHKPTTSCSRGPDCTRPRLSLRRLRRGWRAMTGLPNFLIIGAQKAGTTSLWSYLRAHPDVFMPEHKELDCFYHPDWRDRLAWYRAQFATATQAAVGEASPKYAFN